MSDIVTPFARGDAMKHEPPGPCCFIGCDKPGEVFTVLGIMAGFFDPPVFDMGERAPWGWACGSHYDRLVEDRQGLRDERMCP